MLISEFKHFSYVSVRKVRGNFDFTAIIEFQAAGDYLPAFGYGADVEKALKAAYESFTAQLEIYENKQLKREWNKLQ